MNGPTTDRRSAFRLLEERVASLPEMLERVAASDDPPLGFQPAKIRGLMATGLGSSAAHARYLAQCVAEHVGLAARFVPMSSLAVLPERASEEALVVFSQGLAPNVRPLLSTAPRWGHVIVVTAASESSDGAKGRLLAELRDAGASVRSIPGEDEYGTLVRVVGPMVGYFEALRLAAAIARASSAPAPSLPKIETLRHRVASAGDALDRSLRAGGVASLDEVARGLAFLALGSYGTVVSNLQYKVLEGMLLPLPPVWDFLEFVHGPFQQGFSEPMTLLALGHAGDAREAAFLERIAAILDPSRHRLVRLQAELPGLLAIFEHEAMLDQLMLRFIAERRIDQANWPGRGRDRALYEVEDWVDSQAPGSALRAPGIRDARDLATLTWPETEALIAGGCTTAVVPLGSTEQHGRHLTLATDTRVAERLAELFCARVPEAIRLAAISLGCSSEHGAFPGTLSLEAETLVRVLADVLRSLVRSGFRRAFLFSAHGGNFAAIREAMTELRADCGELTVDAFTDLDRLTRVLHAESAREGISPPAAGHHAGEIETSIMLALDEREVRRAALAPGFVEPTADPQALFYPSVRDRAPNGTIGDPTLASAARGRRYLEVWTALLVAAYRGE